MRDANEKSVKRSKFLPFSKTASISLDFVADDHPILSKSFSIVFPMILFLRWKDNFAEG